MSGGGISRPTWIVCSKKICTSATRWPRRRGPRFISRIMAATTYACSGRSPPFIVGPFLRWNLPLRIAASAAEDRSPLRVGLISRFFYRHSVGDHYAGLFGLSLGSRRDTRLFAYRAGRQVSRAIDAVGRRRRPIVHASRRGPRADRRRGARPPVVHGHRHGPVDVLFRRSRGWPPCSA